MQAQWTPAGGGGTSLGNDASAFFTRLESLGGEAVEDLVPLLDVPVPFLADRGNISGPVVFTVGHSHASRDAAASYYAGQYALIGGLGTLVLTFDAHTLTMANAHLKSVRMVECRGLFWLLRYTFTASTVVYA